ISILEFFYRIDTGGLQQLGIFLADAFDAHAVGDVGPTQQLLLVEAGLLSEDLTAFYRPGSVEQAIARPNSHRLEDRGDLAVDPVDIGDGIGHPRYLRLFFCLPECSNASNKL